MNKENIYEQIYDYCSIPGRPANKNGFVVPKRVKAIQKILSQLGISHTLESFMGRTFNNFYHNIYCTGNSSLCFTAHHDITGASAGANDNSASIINLIALKMNRPDASVVFLDGEEVGGIGSELFSKEIQQGSFPKTKSILNLELTGLGGKRFFIEKEQSSVISELIRGMPQFDYGLGIPVPEINPPFNDAVIFRQNNIDSIVINPLPPLLPGGGTREFFPKKNITFSDGTPLDYTIVSRCNGTKDTIDTISTADMKEFVEEVLIPIFDTWQMTYPI